MTQPTTYQGKMTQLLQETNGEILSAIKVFSSEKVLNKDLVDVVFYHSPCSDGFGSAFIIWHYIKKCFGLERANQIMYIGCTHLQPTEQLSDELLNMMKDKHILMCDFSYRYSELLRLIDVASTFHILDHHKSAAKDLMEIPDSLKVFDMKRSGVGITWDYFFPKVALPKFLALIQDRDLWAKRLVDTPAFQIYFYERPFIFEQWEPYLLDDGPELANAIHTGSLWMEYQQIILNNIVKKTSYVIQEFNNQYVVVLYCNSSEFKSDVGNMMLEKFTYGDFSAIWNYDLYKNQTYYSLRSLKNTTDVIAVAKLYGGGGHPEASGCVLEGNIGCLPLKRIDDCNIFSLLQNSACGTMNINDTEYQYTHFKVQTLRKEWLQGNYLDLIKRKVGESLYIVFEEPSLDIKYNKETNEIIPMKNYVVVHNEKIKSKSTDKLYFLTCDGHDRHICFSESKEFSELFPKKS